MQRTKTFDSTGIALSGRLFAGDLNAIQDAAAGLTDLTQNLSVGTVAIGEAGLLLSRFGAGQARISGALRTDGQIMSFAGTGSQILLGSSGGAATISFGSAADMAIQRDAANNRLLLTPNVYSAGTVVAAGAITAGGALSGTSLTASGAINGASIGVSGAITGASSTLTGALLTGTDVTARNAGAYQTWIGYNSQTGSAALSFVDGLTHISRVVDGSGTVRVFYNSLSTNAYHDMAQPLSLNWIGAPSYALHVSGSIYCSGTLTQSDDRVKTSIKDIGPTLERLLKLSAKTYVLKVPSVAAQSAKMSDRQIGFLASEVEAHFPELVSYHDEVEHKASITHPTEEKEGKVVYRVARHEKDMRAVNYQGFIPIMVEALREISDRLTAAGF